MTLSRVLTFASKGFAYLARKVWTSPAERRVHPWRDINGDRTLRLDYELGPDSVVFDVGGFEGQWASDLFARYCCCIHLFEPVPEYFARIESRFRRNPNIRVYPFGLAGANGSATIHVCGDASSTHVMAAGGAGRDHVISLVSAVDFIREQGIEHIDLMKINIEGGEYELLETMLEAGLVERIANVQVQFHDFVTDARRRMTAIHQALSRTHSPTYQYRFVWENWRLRA